MTDIVEIGAFAKRDSGPVPELERRRIATENTRQRFIGKEFSWARPHCIQLMRFQAAEMGHRLPPLPLFKTAIGAKRALKKRGCDSVEQLLDGMFPRIAPAAMLLGDLAATPGTEGLEGVFVNVGPRKLMGWREDAPQLVVLDVGYDELIGAWRL